MLVVRYSEDNNVTDISQVRLRVPGADWKRARAHVTDAVRTYTEVPLFPEADGSAVLRLQPNSFALIEL